MTLIVAIIHCYRAHFTIRIILALPPFYAHIVFKISGYICIIF